MIHLNQMLVVDEIGTYTVKPLCVADMSQILHEAIQNGEFQSHVTFPNTAELVEELTGIHVPLPREKFERLIILQPGDAVVLVKPKSGFRPQRNQKLRAKDMDMFLVEFEI